MKIIDAYILARTKRKTHRIRMTLVIIVSSLLFAVLFFGAFVFTGVQHSAARFANFGYNGLHLAQVGPAGPSVDYPTAEATVHAAMDNELRARGVKVTDELRNNPEYLTEFGLRIGALITAETATQQASFEAMARQKYAPTAVYHLDVVPALSQVQPSKPNDADPYLTDLQHQIDTGAPTQNQSSFGGSNFATAANFFSVEPGMLVPLLQPGQTVGWKSGQPYPALIPYNYALSLSKKSTTGLTPKQKTDLYRQVMQQYTGKTIQYCYRNSTAQSQLESVLKYNHDAVIDKDPSTKPLAVTPCLGFDQKVLKNASLLDTSTVSDHKPLFQGPISPPPVTRLITIKVAGFVPAMDYGQSSDIFSTMFSSVDSWPAPLPVLIPQTVVDQQPFLKGDSGGQELFGPGGLYFDFATREQQKHFIDEAVCKASACGKPGSWGVQTFGSLKTALEGVFQKGMVVGRWVALGVAVLATILVLLTISKLMSDNRREIAVFRALGAQQRDIAQIYFTYGCMLAVSATLAAIAFGAIGAMIFSHYFAARFNQALVQAVGAYQDPGHSTLFGLQPLWMLAVFGILFASVLVGVAISVLLSRRRNLVTIMREE